MYDYDKDNILTFNASGSFTIDEGALKEFPSDPQTRQGNWILSASQEMITVQLNDDTTVYSLINISEDLLTLAYTERDTATQINYTLTVGFKHP